MSRISGHTSITSPCCKSPYKVVEYASMNFSAYAYWTDGATDGALMPVQAGDFDAARVAEESCRIVGTAGFYPERKVGADYVAGFTAVVEQRLAVAGARLAALLNRLLR